MLCNYTIANDVLVRTRPPFFIKIYSLVPFDTTDMYEELHTIQMEVPGSWLKCPGCCSVPLLLKIWLFTYTTASDVFVRTCPTYSRKMYSLVLFDTIDEYEEEHIPSRWRTWILAEIPCVLICSITPFGLAM